MARKKDVQRDERQSSSAQISTTNDLKLAYVRANHSIELLSTHENARRLRRRTLLLQSQIDELNEQVWEEQERAETAELDCEASGQRCDKLNANLESLAGELRVKTRELDILKTELHSMQNISADSTKLPTEKLALSREVANMKPELEHLRSEAQSSRTLLSEKLVLDRQVRALGTELDDARQTISRLQERQATLAHSSAAIQQLKTDLEESRSELTKAHRAGKVSSDDMSAELEELRTQLATEKSERQRMQKDLTRAQKQAQKTSEDSSQIDELKAQLSAEQRERQALQKSSDSARNKAEADWESQKAVLDDKLAQFHTKLKSTKERLRETEAELEQARNDAAKAPAPKTQAVKNSRKRTASATLDPDAAIGTPGDAQANKRAKRASSVIGEKSTFSITPFLNRTSSVSVAPEGRRQHDTSQDEVIDSIESPSATRPAAAATKSTTSTKVLAPTASTNTNTKPPPTRRRVTARPTLENVAEESGSEREAAGARKSADRGSNEENESPAATKTSKPAQLSKAKPVLKPRKSLASFASFREGSLQPEAVHKKKRKLGNGPKTIFDEEDDEGDGAAVKASFGALGAARPQQRAFGAFGGARSLLSKNRSLKGPVQVADGFAFSPLKKERRAMREASRAASEAPIG